MSDEYDSCGGQLEFVLYPDAFIPRALNLQELSESWLKYLKKKEEEDDRS